LHAPPGERTDRFVAHVKKYYYPDLPEEKIREVLSRGDDRLWRQAERNPDEQEYLMGYMLNILINWETREFEVAKSRQDAARLAGNGEVEATASWIEATDRLLRSHGIPLLVFLVPVGSVDPEYADFWKPWPRAYSWNYICDERGTRLASSLSNSGIRIANFANFSWARAASSRSEPIRRLVAGLDHAHPGEAESRAFRDRIRTSSLPDVPAPC
jgi:hypothetical protein